MSRTTRTVLGLGVMAVGVLGLLAVQALGAPGPRVQPITAAVANAADTAPAPTTVDPALESQVRQMLINRMGLTAAQADALAQSMTQRMQAVHGSDAGNLINACLDQASGTAEGSGTAAPGSSAAPESPAWGDMMQGSGGAGGMMGGTYQ